MSDPLEKFIRNNRDKFDQNAPGSDLWNNIQNGLAQNAAGAGSGAATSAATKTGLAAKLSQLSVAWKITAGVLATLAVCTTIYFTTVSSDENKEEIASTEEIATTPPSDQESADKNLIIPVDDPSPLVNPPLPEADIPFETFTIKARKGGTWTAENGTTIEVPKGIFVDADGNPVKGEVTIHYREFHDAADIILSGITMKYDDEGTLRDFQTAGMMEIQGTQEGEAVYIREGEEIQIRMASFTEDDDYGLYFLDPENGWEDIGKAKIEQNKDKKRQIQQVAQLPPEPRKPLVITEKDGGIGFNVDYSEFPELKPFKGLKWKPLDQKYADDNEWALTKTWSSINLEEVDKDNLEYRLVLGHRKGKFELDVTPMFNKSDHGKEMARFDKRLKRFNKIKKDREQKLAILNAQADIRRSFGIAGFGTYNCDRFFRNPNTWTLNVEMEMPNDFEGLTENEMDVYHITRDNRMVVPYKKRDLKSFNYFPQEENYLVVLFPDKTIGVVKPKEFDKVDTNLSRKEEHKHTFKAQQVEHKINNAADLRFALGI